MPGGYVVRDANGQSMAFVYSRDNEDDARQAKLLTKDEARRVAVNIARLVSSSAAANEQVVRVLAGTTGQNSCDVFGSTDVAATDEGPVAAYQDYRLASFTGMGGGNRER